MPVDDVKDTDVLVVGGGMVGAALAAALAGDLAGHGLTITVVDAEVPATARLAAPASVHDIEPRVSALTLATQTLLANLGAWMHLSPARCGGYTRMEVWDADGTGSIGFDAAETGTTTLGWIVENREVAAALHAACLAHANIDWRAPARVASFTRDGGRWQVALDDGSRLSARLLVGADGAQSQVREQAGFDTRAREYRQHALVATVETERPHGGCARQRFMPDGPLAFLPLADGTADSRYCSIVWSTSPGEAARLLALDDEAFARELGGALEGRLGTVTTVSRRASLPLIERHAVRYAQDGVALVGDAAHTVHPLAGQGVNLGFLDAATLAEELARNLTRGLPFDEPQALRRYERRRRLHNTLMQKSFAGFKVLFGEHRLPVRWLRNTGMSLLDRSPPLKVLVARQAMGLDGDLPARCRPAVRGSHLL